MKRIAVLAILVLALAPAMGTHAQVTGKTFNVTVKSSFGTTFTSCFSFDVPGTGQLSIGGLSQPVTYRHGQLDEVNTRFKAVSRFGQPLSIMFYGEEVEALEQLNGEAVNEFGATFVFSGPEAASCPAAPAGAASPWAGEQGGTVD